MFAEKWFVTFCRIRKKKEVEMSFALDPVKALSASLKKKLRTKMLAWYGEEQRKLPWREKSSPYRVWLSEIMLQQTRVETVLPYFSKFMEVFPTIESLAKSDESEVLSLWSGLGYYRRAKNLHQCAKMVCSEHGGVFPSTSKELLRLPGIGKYTAGAILSIAFQQQEPLVDGNVYRVFSRWFGIEWPLGSKELDKACWEMAHLLVKGKHPADWNQSLMELGALICLPQNPKCESCPVSDDCKARKEGREREFPFPKLKPTRQEQWLVFWFLATEDNKVLLKQNPEKGVFAGLWEFPGFYQKDEGKKWDTSQIQKQMEQEGWLVGDFSKPWLFQHVLSHRKLLISVYPTQKMQSQNEKSKWREFSKQELKTVAISSIVRKVLKETWGDF